MPGTRPGPNKNGIGADGKPVQQRSYNVTNQRWFSDENKLMPKQFRRLAAADVAHRPPTLDAVDSLGARGRPGPGRHQEAPLREKRLLREPP